MTVNENWAVNIGRIDAFLNEQTEVLCYDGIYKYRECTITLTPCTGNIGAVTVDRTQVCFDGPEDQVKEIYKKFFLRFLSAGG